MNVCLVCGSSTYTYYNFCRTCQDVLHANNLYVECEKCGELLLTNSKTQSLDQYYIIARYISDAKWVRKESCFYCPRCCKKLIELKFVEDSSFLLEIG